MTKILIFGGGSIGCAYGYILTKGGAEVTLVCRSNYDVVRQTGITLHSDVLGKGLHYRPAWTVRSVEEAVESDNTTTSSSSSSTREGEREGGGGFDFILVSCKTFSGAVRHIRPAVGPNTAIVLAQNGIGIEDEYVKAYPANTVISGVIWFPVTQTAPGVVVHMTELENFDIGVYRGTSSSSSSCTRTAVSVEEARAKTQQLAQIWQTSGAHCVVHEDVQRRRWAKMAVNATWNPMCALTRCDDTNLLLSSDMAAETMRAVKRDVARVAAAAGYEDVVTEEMVEWDINRARDREGGGKEPSMLVDVRAGREIEVDAILGNMVRMAKGMGVEVPYLETLYVLVCGLNFATLKGERWRSLLVV